MVTAQGSDLHILTSAVKSILKMSMKKKKYYYNLNRMLESVVEFKIFFLMLCSVKIHVLHSSVALSVKVHPSVVRATAGALDNSWTTAACAGLYRGGAQGLKEQLAGWRHQ